MSHNDSSTPTLEPLSPLGQLFYNHVDALEAVDQTFYSLINTDHPFFNDAALKLLSKPGKRIRSLLVFLMAKSEQLDERITHFASIVECLHLATLVHDDVIDESDSRRNQATAHTHIGNRNAILCGDFLLATTFQWISDIRHHSLNDYMANITKEIVMGELDQSILRGSTALEIDTYYDLILKKTGLLFEACCYGTAMILNRPNLEGHRLFGQCFGKAYQMIDDWLDYDVHNTKLNKNTLDDWNNGTPTLPLLLAYQQNPSLTSTIDATFGRHACPEAVLAAILDTRPMVMSLIQKQIDEGLSALDQPSDAIIDLCQWMTQRTH